MNFRRTAVRLFRFYFWALVVASVVTVLWLLDQFVVEADVVSTGWFAIVGFGAVVSVFLIVIRRAAR